MVALRVLHGIFGMLGKVSPVRGEAWPGMSGKAVRARGGAWRGLHGKAFQAWDEPAPEASGEA
ncbi:hypothetical protein GCM10020216_040740 [Nonomuraea helvata]